jgi:hypothetical protein
MGRNRKMFFVERTHFKKNCNYLWQNSLGVFLGFLDLGSFGLGRLSHGGQADRHWIENEDDEDENENEDEGSGGPTGTALRGNF